MKLSDIIFVPTVQHTGTWFVLNFLKRFIPTIRESTVIFKNNRPITEPMIIYTHFPIMHKTNFQFDMDFPFEHEIKENKKSMPVKAISMITNLFRTVIPLRDPFAAILTREARHPELRHFFIVDAFKKVAEMFASHENVKFFPIDLAADEERRRSLLIDTLVHCGIDPNPHHDIICSTAKEWKPENSTPSNRFRAMYQNKDIYGIKTQLGAKWAEIEYLKNSASIILPLLEAVGYTKGDIDLW